MAEHIAPALHAGQLTTREKLPTASEGIATSGSMNLHDCRSSLSRSTDASAVQQDHHPTTALSIGFEPSFISSHTSMETYALAFSCMVCPASLHRARMQHRMTPHRPGALALTGFQRRRGSPQRRKNRRSKHDRNCSELHRRRRKRIEEKTEGLTKSRTDKKISTSVLQVVQSYYRFT
jgi:hypothetical protein